MKLPPRCRILVLRTSAPGYTALGNLVVSLPSLQALRDAYPEAWITALVEPLGAELLEGSPWVNERLTYEPRGKNRGPLGFLSIVRELRRRRFDAAIAFKRFLRSHLLAFLSGAPVRIGFRPPRGWNRPEDRLARLLLTVEVPYDEGRPLVEVNGDLVRPLGIEGPLPPPRLPRLDPDRRSVDGWMKERGISPPFLVVHAGGVSERAYRFPPDRLAEGIRRLSERLAWKVLVLAGPGEEPEAEGLARGIRGARVASGLRIRAAAELIRRASLAVTSDSGPSHLAGAVGTPVVVLYGPPSEAPSKMRRWLPPGGKAIGVPTDASVEALVEAARGLVSAGGGGP